MQMKKTLTILLLAGLAVPVAVPSPTLYAETTALDAVPQVAPSPTKKKLNLPRTGEIASLVITDQDNVDAPMPWGADNQIGDLGSPIMGSITHVGENWIVRITNSTDDRTLNASFNLKQFDSRGRTVRSEPFTYSLRPKESVERRVRAALRISRVTLDLTDWKER